MIRGVVAPGFTTLSNSKVKTILIVILSEAKNLLSS
jgi:hypothetical protein